MQILYFHYSEWDLEQARQEDAAGMILQAIYSNICHKDWEEQQSPQQQVKKM